MARFYASVCKQTIAQNNKLPACKRRPPIRVSRGKYGKPTRHWALTIPAGARLVCKPTAPMPWGAKVWLEWSA